MFDFERHIDRKEVPEDDFDYASPPCIRDMSEDTRWADDSLPFGYNMLLPELSPLASQSGDSILRPQEEDYDYSTFGMPPDQQFMEAAEQVDVTLDVPLHGDMQSAADDPTVPAIELVSLPRIILPRYDYVGPLAKAPDAVEGIDGYLRTTQIGGETQEIHDHEYAEQFTALGDTMLDLGHDLGLDLSSRLRPSSYFHLYDTANYVLVRQQYGLSDGLVAVHSTSGHMLVSEGGSPLSTLANMGHELVHVMARKSIRPEIVEGEQGYILSSSRSHDGYENSRSGTLRGLNEALTEMTSIDLMCNYWPRHSELNTASQEPYENVGYLPELILFDELFKARLDDPRAAFKDLQKGMFTGDMSRLRIITDVVGTSVMRQIALGLNNNDPAQAVALAERLGLREAVEKIKSNTKEGLLDWL